MAHRTGPPPLTDAGFQILLSLADGERHGYEIMQHVSQSGLSKLGPTTLYRTIRTLQEAGLIDESDRRPAQQDDDGRRRYYRLTHAGAEAARAEIARLRHLLELAETTNLAARARRRPPQPRIAQ